MKSYFSKQQRKQLIDRNNPIKTKQNTMHKSPQLQQFYQKRAQSNSKNQNKLKQIPIIKPYDQDKLDFSHNIIRKIENLDHYKNSLKYLNLSHNKIIKIEGIFNLKKIQQVNLAYNLIENVPNDFQNLKTLKYLSLHYNKLLNVEQFDCLRTLKIKKLTLEGNLMTKNKDYKKYLIKILTYLQMLDKITLSPINRQNIYQTPLQISQQQIIIDNKLFDLKTSQKNINVTQVQLSKQYKQKTKQNNSKQNSSTQRRSKGSVVQKLALKEITQIYEDRLNQTQRQKKQQVVRVNSYRSQLDKNNTKELQIRIQNEEKKFNENLCKLMKQLEYKKQNMIQGIMNLQKIKMQINNIKKVKNGQKECEFWNKIVQLMDWIQKCGQLWIDEMEYLLNKCEIQRVNGSECVNYMKEIRNRRRQLECESMEGLKYLELLNLQLLNIEMRSQQQNIDRGIMKQLNKIYNRLRNSIIIYEGYSNQYLNQLYHYLELILLKQNKCDDDHSQINQLKKLLFYSNQKTNQKQSNIHSQFQILRSKYQLQINKNQTLLIQNSKLLNQIQQKSNQYQIKITKLQLQISEILHQKNSIQNKWNNINLFHSNNTILFQNIYQKQNQIIKLLQHKLSTDFFQNIILNQSLTIQSLLKNKKQVQDKYLTQLHKYRSASKYQATLKNKQNYKGDTQTAISRYPDSVNIAAISSAQSHFIQNFSSNQKNQNNKQKIQKNVSEFVINNENQSARFQYVVCNSRQKGGMEYFKKSNGFSFKKNCKKQNLQTINGSNNSKKNNKEIEYVVSNENEQNVDKNNIWSGKWEKCSKENMLLSKQKLKSLNQIVDRRSKQYYEINLQKGQSYKNYIKYHLRNNIIEILSNNDMHPNLKTRWSKDQLKHIKYHTLNGPKLINKQKTRSLDKYNRSIN